MKSKPVFGKKALVMSLLILALGAAVWLNMEYSSSGGFIKTEQTASNKNLGEAKYVAKTESETVKATVASEADYFAKTRADREKTRNEELSILEEAVKNVKSDSSAKSKATEKVAALTSRMEKENAIETVIKSKGFEDAIVVIGDNNINVVVKSSDLLQSQTLQIQDAVVSETKASLENIKIVNIK